MAILSGVTAWRGVHDLLYTTTRAKDAIGTGVHQDWIGMSANILGGVGKIGWYARDKFTFLKDGLELQKGVKYPAPTPTAIVDVAMVVVGLIDACMGMWPPDRGHEFDTGRAEFESMQLWLRLADPDEAKWSGDTAKNYAAQNKELQDLAQKMQELDKTTQARLQNQADVVQDAHTALAVCLMLLVFAQLAAMVIWAAGPGGPAASVLFQTAFVTTIFLLVVGYVGAVIESSYRNATELNKLANDYKDVGQKAEPSGTFTKISVHAAEESTVSSVADISASMSGASAMPDFATVANIARANASAGENPLLSAFTGDGETPGDSASDEVADTPASTMPTLAQLTAMSGQAAKISGHLSQHVNLFNQGMGQIQQIASMAQQGQGAAAPAEEAAAEEAALAGAAPAEATLAGDVEGAGAALGTEAAERAPIDAAAIGPEQAQEPSPAERIV
jgi:hypothetical protein